MDGKDDRYGRSRPHTDLWHGSTKAEIRCRQQEIWAELRPEAQNHIDDTTTTTTTTTTELVDCHFTHVRGHECNDNDLFPYISTATTPTTTCAAISPTSIASRSPCS